jgi:hypothetical protein
MYAAAAARRPQPAARYVLQGVANDYYSISYVYMHYSYINFNHYYVMGNKIILNNFIDAAAARRPLRASMC